MTRITKEEAVKIINCYDIGFYDLSGEKIPADKLADAFDMAIEALQTPPITQRSMYQAGYRQGREEALKREPQKSYPTEWCEQCDLWEDNKCVGVAQCKHNIKALKHVTSDDLISRTEAIEAIELVDWYHQNSNKDMVHGANDDEHQAWYKADDVYKALEAVPSADRPRGQWVSKEELIDAINDMEVVYDGDDDGHKEHDISELVRVMFKDIIDNLSTTTKGEA